MLAVPEVNVMPEREDLEMIVGLTLMMSSWALVFLMVIGLFDLPSEQKIATSLLLYALSVAGLVLSSHGYVVKLAVRKRRELEKVKTSG